MAGNLVNNIPRKDVIEWDVLNWSRLVAYWQPVIEKLPRNARVLAIGERRGGLSLWLASLGFSVECTDIADHFHEARTLHHKHGLEKQISYRLLDIVNECPGAETYDIIIAKSVLGGLKMDRSDAATRTKTAQIQAIENIQRSLKPGGYFFSAENMEGGRLVQLMRSLSGKTRGWQHLAYKDLTTLFSPFRIVETKTFGILPTLFPYSWLNSIMYFLNKYVLFILPVGNRYIAFTTAQK